MDVPHTNEIISVPLDFTRSKLSNKSMYYDCLIKSINDETAAINLTAIPFLFHFEDLILIL